jgi:hypothetical protein
MLGVPIPQATVTELEGLGFFFLLSFFSFLLVVSPSPLLVCSQMLFSVLFPISSLV